jgi:WD40 repeat protein
MTSEGDATIPLGADSEPQPRPVAVTPDRYDAFLSYSRAADAGLAPALQAAIERVGRPWHKPRARRLFRDKATLTPGPSLWDKLQHALEQSRWYVLLCSPQSAASRWVGEELSWWLRTRGADRLLLVVTGGELVFDRTAGRVDAARTTCLPAFAAELFDSDPLWVDLRWAQHRTPSDPAATARFHDTAAEIAAAISGVAKDELVGENIRQRRRTRNIVRGTITVLSVLVLLAAGGGVVALQQRNLAQTQLLQATSRQLVAGAAGIRDTQPDLARQLILTAYRQAPTAEALGAVLTSATVPVTAPLDQIADLVAADPVRNLAAFAGKSAIEVRSTADAAVVASLPLSSPLDTLAYAGDGALLAASDEKGVLRLWSLADPTAPQPVGRFDLDAGRAGSLAFLGSSHHLAIASQDGTLSIVDVSDPDRIASLDAVSGSGQEAAGLIASGDGRRLVSCADQLTVWDASSPRRFRAVGQLDVGGCSTMALSPDGYLLAVATGDLVTLYDIADPSRPRALAPLAGQGLGAGPLAFSTDRSSLAIGAGDGSVRIWSVADPLRPLLTDQMTGLGGSISALSFSGSSDSLLVQITGQVSPGEASGWLRIWPVRAGARSTQLGELFTPGSQVGFTPDQRFALAGLPPRLWDISDRRQPAGRTVIGGYRFGGQGMAVTHDGDRLAVGTPPVFYDLSSSQQPHRLTQSAPAEQEPQLVSFLPGDRTLLTSGDDLVLWDVSDPAAPRQVSAIEGSPFRVQAAALSGDGRRLAVIGDGETVVYDLSDTAEPKPAFHLSTPAASVVTFLGGADVLALGDGSGTLHVWKRDDDNYVEIGSAHRHTGNIGGIGAHPSQPWVATGGEDGTVRLWDMSDPLHPAELAAYRHGSSYDGATIWFSPDGRTLATSSAESIRLWNVDLSGILGELCDRSTDITATAWSAYLPQRPYDPPCR